MTMAGMAGGRRQAAAGGQWRGRKEEGRQGRQAGLASGRRNLVEGGSGGGGGIYTPAWPSCLFLLLWVEGDRPSVNIFLPSPHVYVCIVPFPFPAV